MKFVMLWESLLHYKVDAMVNREDEEENVMFFKWIFINFSVIFLRLFSFSLIEVL
jgi:hypothetical protein